MNYMNIIERSNTWKRKKLTFRDAGPYLYLSGRIYDPELVQEFVESVRDDERELKEKGVNIHYGFFNPKFEKENGLIKLIKNAGLR
jgi:hypothetical protein